MEQDIKSIMELLQKGVITPEEAETMIKAISKNESFTDSATRHVKSVGEKIGEGIDDVTPKVKSLLKNCFEVTANFSQKMADKLNEEKAYEDEMFEDDEEFEMEFDMDIDFDSDSEMDLNDEDESSEEIIELLTKEDKE